MCEENQKHAFEKKTREKKFVHSLLELEKRESQNDHHQ